MRRKSEQRRRFLPVVSKARILLSFHLLDESVGRGSQKQHKTDADVDAAIFIQTAESEKANERRTPFLLGPRETRREEGWSWFVRPSVEEEGGVVYDALSRT